MTEWNWQINNITQVQNFKKMKTSMKCKEFNQMKHDYMHMIQSTVVALSMNIYHNNQSYKTWISTWIMSAVHEGDWTFHSPWQKIPSYNLGTSTY